jgi:hypothetical protein
MCRYDYLILTPGLEFRVPKCAESVRGAITINPDQWTAIDKELHACARAKYLDEYEDTRLILYGDHLTAYTMMHHAIKCGVQATRIIQIYPQPADKIENYVVGNQVN